jgi:hypothetical protein
MNSFKKHKIITIKQIKLFDGEMEVEQQEFQFSQYT